MNQGEAAFPNRARASNVSSVFRPTTPVPAMICHGSTRFGNRATASRPSPSRISSARGRSPVATVIVTVRVENLPRLKLRTVRISPLGITYISPDGARSSVARRVMDSIIPSTPAISTFSPTA